MAIKVRLMELRFYIIFVFLFAAAVFSFLRLGPGFATVINFFWPLLLSTGFFLAAVAVLLRISPPPPDSSCDRTGEELMDYVAGQPQDDVAEGGSGEAESDEKEQEEQDEHRKSQ